MQETWLYHSCFAINHLLFRQKNRIILVADHRKGHLYMPEEEYRGSGKPKEPSKSYQRVIQFVRDEIESGHLKPGDKLPTERVLAVRLDIARGSVREGLRVLENIGVLSSMQGAGNYISCNFDDTMSEMLGFMYYLLGTDNDMVLEFRWMLEREALRLAISRIQEEEKRAIMADLEGLESARNEEERSFYDRRLHRTMVHACRNHFLAASYDALMAFDERYIHNSRARIIGGMKTRDLLDASHRMICEGLTRGNYELASAGLEQHFRLIGQYGRPL